MAGFSIIKVRGYILGKLAYWKLAFRGGSRWASQVTEVVRQLEMCGSAEWEGWDLSIKSVEDREQANVDLKNKL